MNAWSIVSCATVIGCLSIQPSFALNQTDDSIFGTHSVVFQPGQSNGVLHSCTLTYRATQADYAYRKGSPILIVGNIGIRQFDTKMIMTLKIGVMDIDVPNALFTRPYFAYLQTPNATMAKSSSKAMDGEKGFRLIAIGLNDTTGKLLLEMLESGKVTIGFNRMKDGLDVLVPVDLTVFDAEYLSSGKVIRKHSNEAISQFLACNKELLRHGSSKSSN